MFNPFDTLSQVPSEDGPPSFLQPAVPGPGHPQHGGGVAGGHGQRQHVHLRDRPGLHHDGARGSTQDEVTTFVICHL